MKKIRAFTLAETIMTLFIVGLVVTASIPLFTTQRSTAPAITNVPWEYCDADKERGLCASEVNGSKPPILIGDGSIDTGYNMTVKSSLPNYFSPFDMFKSDDRKIRVGNYIFAEDKTNFYINAAETGNKFPENRTNTQNVVIGNNSLNTSPLSSNVIMGHNTINNNDSVANSVLIGTNTNSANTPISNSIIIGNNTDGTNAIKIGNSIAGSASGLYIDTQNNITADSNGGINIGNVITGTNAGIKLGGALNVGSDDNSYDITLQGALSATSVSINSDERLKNIKGKYEKGLNEVLQIEPIIFKYKGQNSKNIGVIAQDVQKIFPEAVVKMPDGYLGVNTDPIFFGMLNAIKEVNKQTNEELERQAKLQKELNELQADLESLTACKGNDFKSKLKCFLYDAKMFLKSLIATTRNENKITKTCHCEEAMPTKQSRSINRLFLTRLPHSAFGFVRNDMENNIHNNNNVGRDYTKTIGTYHEEV